MKRMGLRRCDAQDRTMWRNGVFGKRPTSASAGWTKGFRILEERLRRKVSIDDMQCGFRPGRGTTDAIFIIRQVQEKLLAKNKELWIAFVDLEKAFDRVPREVL